MSCFSPHISHVTMLVFMHLVLFCCLVYFLFSYIPSVEVFAMFRQDLDEHIIEKIISPSRHSEYLV